MRLSDKTSNLNHSLAVSACVNELQFSELSTFPVPVKLAFKVFTGLALIIMQAAL